MKNRTVSATLAALGAQIVFGFSFMLMKISLQYASPLTVIADRYIVAFIGLTAVMLITRTKIKVTKSIGKLIAMSIFQPVLYFLFESYGIEMTTSAFSSIMISLVPVASMISGMVFLKEFPSPMQYVFTALSVGGVVIVALVGKEDGTVTGLGVLFLLGAVLSSVAYNTMSRKISEEFTAFERTYAMAVIGLIVFMGIALIENIDNPQNIIVNFTKPVYIMSILYLGIAASVIAFSMLNYANTYLPVAKTTAFSNITTVVSVFAGIVFIGEKFTAVTIISTAMLIIGVWGVQMLNVKKKN